MKRTNCFFAVCLIVLASGCALNRNYVVLTPVGPPPRIAANNAPEGGLAIHSAFDVGGGGIDSEQQYHSGYKIYSLDGKSLRYVNNKVGIIEDPQVVSLPPGRYNVVARAAAFGSVTVPVVIEAGKTTSVHLDGSELTSGIQTSAQGLVSLPDGLIIGWSAQNGPEGK